jgi:hypothetical protein
VQYDASFSHRRETMLDRDQMKKVGFVALAIAAVTAAVILKKNGTSLKDVAEKTASLAKNTGKKVNKGWKAVKSAVNEGVDQVKEAQAVIAKSFENGKSHKEVKSNDKNHKKHNRNTRG